jgi:hypothetical protein
VISRDEAFQKAVRHAASGSLGHPDYFLECEFRREVEDGWLFEYQIRCRRDIPPEDWERFAGAAGFVVSTTGQIRDLSVPMYVELAK